MVTQLYDIFNRQEKPEVTLCNPNKDELYSMKAASSFIVKRRYNATSEIEMTIPKEVDGVTVPGFEYVSQKRLLKVDDTDIGYFVISDVSIDDSGAVPVKNVRGLSLEFSMMAKKLSAFGGTMAIYDVLDPDNSLLGRMLAYIPAWSIGTIDSTLLTKFRTFDVADTNIYNFLMTEASDAYGCVFTFDTVNNEISATAIENVSSPTDVYFSHDNVIENSELDEVADELTTALYVYGGGDLDIRTVNPLGTNVIYNFSYYQTTDWMTQDLIDAITDWEALILANQATYASTLTSLKSSLANLVVLEGELVDLNSEYLALEATQRARIESGQSLTDINILLAAKQVEIDSKENEITNENTTITNLRSTLEGINTTLSFESNFTSVQIEELSYFTFENTYQNENLVQLDSMDADEVQDLAQTLYDQGVIVLARISQPRYEYSMDTASVLALKEYETFTDQLELGSTVYVEKDDGSTLTLVLLEMSYDYENPQGFSMTFSNRLRLDNGDFVFSDLFGQPVKTGTTVKFDKLKWANWASTYKNDVTSFITSSLDASTNNLINASDEEIKIYDNGLRGKHWDSVSETYDSREVWLTSNMLAFTNDSWATAEMAIGEIDFNGTPLYGVVDSFVTNRLMKSGVDNDNI